MYSPNFNANSHAYLHEISRKTDDEGLLGVIYWNICQIFEERNLLPFAQYNTK